MVKHTTARWLISATVVGALPMLAVLAGCAPGALATVTNECEHPVDALVDEVSSQDVEQDFDLDVFRDSTRVESYESGATRQYGLTPSNSPRTVMIIVYGTDTAKVEYFGGQLTGSLDYTITGDMCLIPAETN